MAGLSRLIPLAHPPIRVVARLAHGTALHGQPEPTLGLVEVRTVVEGARPQVVAEVGEARRQLGSRDLPETELANARGIGDVAAGAEGMQLGVRRRVAALVKGLRHLTGLESKARLDGVEQRRLADAGRAGDDRDP